MLSRVLFTVLLLAWQANAAAVFAHFMVGNTASYTSATWGDEIRLAQEAHIDAFALNIAKDESMNVAQVANAFSAANSRGFKLFFSFDYAGRGPWQRDKVLEFLRGYTSNGAYYKEEGLPLVSTFEGWQQSQDWRIIKSQLNILFVPDWSSLGAQDALNVGNSGLVNGLFSWAAWPNLDNDMPAMDTYGDASYQLFLNQSGELPYMMPVSPWFYANMPGYDKNWKWSSETLWFDRWHQALVVKPRWIEIISWNDYGESHYIGPVRTEALTAFGPQTGKPPFNYASGMPHDGWRSFLPYAIDLYKSGTSTVTREGVTAWYRLQSKQSGCSDGDTTTNTATHLQVEHPSDEGNIDGVYFAALLGSAATPEVRIGSTVVASGWTFQPDGGVGIYRGWAPSSLLGAVTVTLKRGSTAIVTLTGDKVIGGCQDGKWWNFNPIVKTTLAPGSISATPLLRVQDQGCVRGTGKGDFKLLCEYTHCSYDYCPPAYCDTVEHPNLPVNYASPFTPPSCIQGTGEGAMRDLCWFGCQWGFCPIKAPCTCTATGVILNKPHETGEKPTKQIDSLPVRQLCNFACNAGWCKQDGICNDLPAPTWPISFQIYYGSIDNWEAEGEPEGFFFFFRSQPDCNDVIQSSEIYPPSGIEDLSDGYPNGVICDPGNIELCGSLAGPHWPERFEFKTSWGHYTIYQDRDYGMYDTNDNLVGQCYPNDEHTYTDCHGTNGAFCQGQRIFLCDSKFGPYT